jgi:hypothetical protein
MPTYVFRNLETGEMYEAKMSYKDLDQYKIDNNVETVILAENLPMMSDANRMSVPGTKSADSTFEKYVINRIKESVPGNTIKDGHKTKMSREW